MQNNQKYKIKHDLNFVSFIKNKKKKIIFLLGN